MPVYSTNLTLNWVFYFHTLFYVGDFEVLSSKAFSELKKKVFRGLTRAWKNPKWDGTPWKFWEAASLAALQKCKVVKCILFIGGKKESLGFQSNFVCRHRANIFGSNWQMEFIPHSTMSRTPLANWLTHTYVS